MIVGLMPPAVDLTQKSQNVWSSVSIYVFAVSFCSYNKVLSKNKKLNWYEYCLILSYKANVYTVIV